MIIVFTGAYVKYVTYTVALLCHNPVVDNLTYEQEKHLWLHWATLTHLVTNPEEVMELAQQNIERWIPKHRADGRSVEHLQEWQEILDRGLHETVKAVLSTSPHACELRQNSPFAGVLSDQERAAALKSFRLPRP